jgi:Fic-DOC domain mobile mystery protein B
VAGEEWGPDPEGATPLDDEQRAGLIPPWVATRADLNEAEADNILEGQRKWRRRVNTRGKSRLTLDNLLDHLAVRTLHRNMYGEVWSWAGEYRNRDLNIGVSFWQVSEAVVNLLEDAKYWFATDDPSEIDKAAARFHHRLVQIHPFPNGNGRHSREMTDLVLLVKGRPPFTWGRVSLTEVSETRRKYIRALQWADQGEYSELEGFVRT